MRERVLWGLLAVFGCGDDGGGDPPPTIGDPCGEESPLRCAKPGGSQDETTVVAVCEGESYVLGLACPQGEVCFEEGSREAPACREINDYTVYGDAGEPCLVDGALACSLDQATILECRDGSWQSGESCTNDGRRCQTLRDTDDACDSADGCVVCVI